MKQRVFAILETLLIAVFFFSLYKIADALFIYKDGQDDYVVAQETFVSEEVTGPYSPLGINFEVDFDALKAINTEVYGWIHIPDTNIDYPIVWHNNNKYYERLTYDKKRLTCGSIFMDKSCATDFSDDNVIIHGHNMKDLSMFGTLKYYDSLDYLEEHPYIYILLEDRAIKYEIFSVHYTEIKTSVYTINFKSDKAKVSWAEKIADNSKIDIGLHDFSEDDTFITLSTCSKVSDEGRLCIVARKADEIFKEGYLWEE